MQAKRTDGGYVFHGGCNGCTQPLHICPKCQYMEPNWELPCMNPEANEKRQQKQEMKKRAYQAEREALK